MHIVQEMLVLVFCFFLFLALGLLPEGMVTSLFEAFTGLWLITTIDNKNMDPHPLDGFVSFA